MAPPSASEEDQAKALAELQRNLEGIEDTLKESLKVMSGGYPEATLIRFLKAREFDPAKSLKMLTDCLRWRVENDIDNILSRPLLDDKYEKVRSSQLYGMSGYDNEGRPVLCVRVGLSFMDPSCKLEEYIHSHIQHNEYRDRVLLPEASRKKGSPVTTSVKVFDMSGLKLTQLGRMQMHRAVATVDDLNYPEKSEIYYVVNSPSVFSACWKAVKPLLQERTKKKVQVLTGNGAAELLQSMGESALPHFVRYAPPEGLGSSKNLLVLDNHEALKDKSEDCCHPSHPYHVELHDYMLKLRQRAKEDGLVRNTSHREVPQCQLGTGCDAGEETDIGQVVEEAIAKSGVSDSGVSNGVAETAKE